MPTPVPEGSALTASQQHFLMRLMRERRLGIRAGYDPAPEGLINGFDHAAALLAHARQLKRAVKRGDAETATHLAPQLAALAMAYFEWTVAPMA
jgi:hypothetical protein